MRVSFLAVSPPGMHRSFGANRSQATDSTSQDDNFFIPTLRKARKVGQLDIGKAARFSCLPRGPEKTVSLETAVEEVSHYLSKRVHAIDFRRDGTRK